MRRMLTRHMVSGGRLLSQGSTTHTKESNMADTAVGSLHIWHVHPTTKVRKYVKAVATDYEWLMFKRAQPAAERENYLCNNVSPTGTVGHTVRPVKKHTSSAAEAMAAARAESNRRENERRRQRAVKQKQDEERRAQDAEMMKGIKGAAEGLLEKHKHDEQADLDAGINR